MRGWLDRADVHAQLVCRDATQLTRFSDPLLGPAEPTDSALGDALEALGRAAVAAVLRRLAPRI